jgi:Calcineurin-like phosphoesterase
MWLPLVLALEVTNNYVTILQMTDLHYADSDWQDRNTTNLQNNLLEWEKPDVVVLTGDLVSEYNWKGESNWYLENYKKYVKPMKDYKVPWALGLGNHDIGADLTGDEIMDIDVSEPLSLSKTRFKGLSHASNFYVPITYKNKVQLILWILDSGGKDHLEIGFDRVHDDQLKWMKYTQETINEIAGYQVPGMIFMHIPPPEYLDIFEVSVGNKYEAICCPGNGTRYLLSSLNNIIGVAVGHDHFNDYQGKIGNVTLFYGRKTGYGSTGPYPYFLRGARVFVFNFTDQTLDSWIREEDGNKLVHTTRHGNFEPQDSCAEKTAESYFIYILPFVFAISVIGYIFFLKKKEASIEVHQI